MKYLNNVQKSRILHVKNIFLKSGKYRRKLNDSELKDTKMKNRKEIDNPCTKSITIPAADMDKFGIEEMMRKRPHAKNNWYDWLINYIPKPIKKR